MDAAIQVKNTGDVPLVLGDGYIRIADENGNVIAEESGEGVVAAPAFLGVGDVAFIYSTSPIRLPEGYAPDAHYLAQASADLTACKEVVQYPTSNLKIYEDANGKPTVSGTVTNDKDEVAQALELAVAYVDNDDTTLGVASEVMQNLAPGESREFTIRGDALPVGCTLAVISNYDVIAAGPQL